MPVGISLDTIRKVALALPGVVEGHSYRTTAFRASGKLLCRVHQDGKTLVVHCDPFEREVLLETAPKVFFVTDHYVSYSWILVRFETATRAQLTRLLSYACEQLRGAPKMKKKSGRRPGKHRR
jgi:hypothetical protein